MAKKISYLFLGSIFILLFWFILGTKYTYNDETNAFSKLQCVSYAPYDKDQSPFDPNYKISEDLVRKDLKLLSKYTECIRTYATVGMEIIPQIARENNLKMYLGAWVNSDPKSTKKEIDTLVKTAKENHDVVKAVIVGNEVLLRREISEQQLFDYIKYVKEQLPNTKVTYADVWEFWLKHPSIKNATDFVTIHILPYWEDEPKHIEEAIKHLENVRLEVEEKLGSDKILIGETGWPSEGRMREEAFPSKINQAKFVREFVTLANKHNWQYNIIEALDQPWKRISEGAVGGYWGLFDENRNDKYVFKGEVSNFPNYAYLMIFSLILFVLFSTLIIKKDSRNNQIIQFSLVNAVFAILFSFQIEQYFTTTRTNIELVWAILVLTIHLYVYYFTLKNILNESKILLPKNIFYVLSSLVAINSIVLAFDGRYQNFEIYGFIISTLSLIYLIYMHKSKFEELKFSHFAKLLSIILLITSLLILYNEKATNLYSDIWIIISLIYAHILFKGSQNSSFSEIKKLLAFIVVISLTFFAIKYYIFMNDSVRDFCNINKAYSLCRLKDTIGYLLYLKLLGYTSLLFLSLALVLKKSMFFWIAIFLSIASIALFNTSMGALVFVLSIFFLMKNIEDKN